MDVLAKLDEELKSRKDYTLEQKRRYLYLRTCQLFSYDSRYHYCTYDLLGEKADKIKNEIIQNKINLKDVTDFRVVCKNYSEDVYSVALKELLDTESEIISGGHYYVEFEENGKTIKADATLGDLTRAKMKLMTRGYKAYEDNEYRKKLREIDRKINYIDKNYDDSFWIGLMGIGYYNSIARILDIWAITEEKTNTMMNDILEKEIERKRKGREILLSKLSEKTKEYFSSVELAEELLLIKYQKISQAIENYNELANENNYSLTQFEDAKRIVGDLKIKLNLSDTQEISLFQDYNDKDWDFIEIYPIHLKNGGNIYFTLKKENKVYNFNIIEEDEAHTYVKELKGINKDYFYHK